MSTHRYTLSGLTHQPGFSLVELMVAMVLSLFLLLGVSYVYTGSKQTYKVQANLARIQESGRLAFEYLSREIRAAGFLGCANPTSFAVAPGGNACPTPSTTTPTVLCTLGGTGCTDYDFDPGKTVTGSEADTAATWDPAPPSGVSPLAGTDVITLRSSSATNSSIVHDPTANNASLKVNTVSGIDEGDILIATNCKSSVIFQACQVNSSIVTHSTGNNNGCASPAYGNSCKEWGQTYTGGSLLKLQKSTYYIANDANGVPTLYRRTAAGVVDALVPNIENLQIKYGVAPTIDDYPDDYYTADQVAAAGKWDRVKSVRIELLVRSDEENLVTDKQTIWFNGASFTPSDTRMRLVMVTTVGVRNRMLLSTK
jgi:type IV pilus assembly protein PilW